MIDVRRFVRGDQSRPHLVVAFARRHGVLPFLNRASRPGGRWSHTALWDEERQVFNEALMFKGVVETPQVFWDHHYSAVDLLAVPCPDPRAGIQFARSQLGKPYDYWGAASVPWRESWQDDARWYCSELDVAAVGHAGTPLFGDPYHGIHPHDAWRVMLARALA